MKLWQNMLTNSRCTVEQHKHLLGAMLASALHFKSNIHCLYSPASCYVCLSAVWFRAGNVLLICASCFSENSCPVKLENRPMRAVKLNQTVKLQTVSQRAERPFKLEII